MNATTVLIRPTREVGLLIISQTAEIVLNKFRKAAPSLHGSGHSFMAIDGSIGDAKSNPIF